jgi:hypothetical protein
MMWTLLTLAQQPGVKEASGEGSWITTGFVVAICAGLAGIIAAYRKGLATPAPLKKEPADDEIVTRSEFEKMELEMREGFRKVGEQIESERSIARTAIGNIHKRIDVSQSMISEVKGALDEIKHNVHMLVDAMIKKTTKSS